MPAFVLVHGAWHGGWCWAQVQQHLQAAGALTYAPTLDGLAERARVGGQDITVADHAKELLQLMQADDLQDVILVGHSYAGNVISLVADQLKAQAMHGSAEARTRVRHYCFLDAVVPDPGAKSWSWSDAHSPELRQQRLAAIAANAGMLPVPAASVFGIASPQDQQRVQSMLTPMPGACYTSPVEFRYGATRGLSRSYVAAVAPAYASLVPVHQRVRAESGWTYREIHCGHDAMIDAAPELSRLLLELAANH